MGLKPPYLAKFDERGDPYKYVASINTQMAIIWVFDSLKCKLLSITFKDVVLRWYMGLPRASITNYQELVKKLVHQFPAICHRKMSITSLFNIRSCPPKSLREYLSHINETTIMVVPPNQEIFMGVFHNGVKVGHFNESLTQKPSLSLVEVVTKAECYIKGKESKPENKIFNINESVPNVEGSHQKRKKLYLAHKGQDNVQESRQGDIELHALEHSPWVDLTRGSSPAQHPYVAHFKGEYNGSWTRKMVHAPYSQRTPHWRLLTTQEGNRETSLGRTPQEVCEEWLFPFVR